eukprot:119435-Pelagomonas_calceolata.AAC.1
MRTTTMRSGQKRTHAESGSTDAHEHAQDPAQLKVLRHSPMELVQALNSEASTRHGTSLSQGVLRALVFINGVDVFC